MPFPEACREIPVTNSSVTIPIIQGPTIVKAVEAKARIQTMMMVRLNGFR